MAFLWIGGIILFIIAVAVLILFSKVSLRFTYFGEPDAELRFWFIRIKKDKLLDLVNNKDEASKKEPDAEPKKKGKAKGSIGGFIRFLGHIKRTAEDALSYAAPMIYIKVDKLKIAIASDDAAKTALIYGTAVGAANALLAVLERFCNTKYNSKEISMDADFSSEKSSFEADISFSARIISIVKIRARILNTFYNVKG